MAGASDAAAETPSKKGGGLLGILIPLVVLTVLAAGGGGLIGSQIVASLKGNAATADSKAAPPAPGPAADTAVRELVPVVTNLAAPNAASWVRLQAAIVYNKADAAQIDVLASRINDDILAVVRTLTLAQLQGSSGLELLREDLNERASIRSDGHIRELMIEMLVIQ